MNTELKCECGSNLSDGTARTMDELLKVGMYIDTYAENFIECAGCGFFNETEVGA